MAATRSWLKTLTLVSEEQVTTFGQRHKISVLFPLPDVVYVGVLHTEHWRVGLLFLNAGKNVLCEKPFAMNARQVKELVAAAKKNNVFLMEVRV